MGRPAAAAAATISSGSSDSIPDLQFLERSAVYCAFNTEIGVFREKCAKQTPPALGHSLCSTDPETQSAERGADVASKTLEITDATYKCNMYTVYRNLPTQCAKTFCKTRPHEISWGAAFWE